MRINKVTIVKFLADPLHCRDQEVLVLIIIIKKRVLKYPVRSGTLRRWLKGQLHPK